MKMFKPVTRCPLVFVSLGISLLMIGITGCGEDDDNEWIGTWRLETVDDLSLEQSIADDFGDFVTVTGTSDWRFYSDGRMEVEFNVKIVVKERDLADLSGAGSMRMTGTYSLSGSNYTLTPIELIDATGVFRDLGLEEESLDPSDEDTGTWSRKGNTLTLYSDDGTVRVYKKR